MSANPYLAAIEAGQTLVNPRSNLLWAGFEMDGVKLDLYGTFDNPGYTVEEVAIAGTRIDITALLSQKQMDYLDSKCFWNLAGANEIEQDDRADAYQMRTY